jgi:putative cell wall-binding protein
VAVADGTYLLQLVGTATGTAYAAPSATPATADQVAAFGVTVDHLPVSRQAGTDRFATAAAISAATYAPGVAVAYVATGLDFPDALAAAAAAGHLGAPLLLVSPTAVPPSTAAELARLKPARIVIAGGPSVVSSAVAAAVRLDGGGS